VITVGTIVYLQKPVLAIELVNTASMPLQEVHTAMLHVYCLDRNGLDSGTSGHRHAGGIEVPGNLAVT
jgi:hypothetical protein